MQIIAHRGASAFFKENTLQAFKAAYAMGVNAFETDIQLSKDGFLVLNHDYSINQKPVKEYSLEELKKFNICTLEELLQILDKRSFLNIEIKNHNNIYPGIEEELALCLKKYKQENNPNILVSSFYLPSLYKVKTILPKLKIGRLTENFNEQEIENLNPYSLNTNYEKINKEIIAFCHKRKIKVFIYTVNNLALFEQLKKDGIDAVFSDNPVLNQTNFFEIGASL
jgi:glycerophosphoryl diester phosphodiesterase